MSRDDDYDEADDSETQPGGENEKTRSPDGSDPLSDARREQVEIKEPRVDAETWETMVSDFFREIPGADNPQRAWRMVLEQLDDPSVFEGGDGVAPTTGHEEVEAADESPVEFDPSDEIVGIIGKKGDLNTTGPDENELDSEAEKADLVNSDVWDKFKKFALVCSMPDAVGGYTVEDGEKNAPQGYAETIFYVPAVIDFWNGVSWGEFDSGADDPRDDDIGRVFEYLAQYWDAYEDVSSKEYPQVDPKGALIYAVAGRHCNVTDPTVVFDTIQLEDVGRGHSVYRFEGELNGTDLEVADELGLKIELAALLRMLTLTACYDRVFFERVVDNSIEDGTLEHLDYDLTEKVTVEIDVEEEENTIRFRVATSAEQMDNR